MAVAQNGSENASQTASAPSLSLSAAQFAKISPSSFLAAHLPSTRPSARSPAQARPPTLNINSLTHANGSAVVRIGDTAVVCGIRGEILNLEDANAPGLFQAGKIHLAGSETKDADKIAELDLLVPNIELSTGCNPQHLPGNPPSTLAQSLTQRVITLLRTTDLVHFDGLRIWARGPNGEEGSPMGAEPGADTNGGDSPDMDGDDSNDDSPQQPGVKAFWALYIDVLVMSLDGSAFDAIWAGVLGALQNTRLPDAWWDRDLDQVVCSPQQEQSRKVAIRGCPVACSFAAFDPSHGAGTRRIADGAVHVLVDPDDFEESCCTDSITVVVDQGGTIIFKVELQGGGILEPADMQKLLKRAAQRWEEWKFILETAS